MGRWVVTPDSCRNCQYSLDIEIVGEVDQQDLASLDIHVSSQYLPDSIAGWKF